MANAKLTLDKRRRKTDGTYPVKIAISHNQRTAYISLGISIPADAWDERKNRPKQPHLAPILSARLAEVQGALLSLHPIKHLTANQLRDKIEASIHPDTAPTFGEWYEQFTETHENPRTRAIYDATLHLINLHDKNSYNAKFEEITKAWLESFFASLAQRSPSVNARNIHLRNIRAVFNSAIDNGITECYPFRRLKIRPMETPKRCLTIAQMRELLTMPEPCRHLAAFRLSFYLIGMNMADLLTLTPDNVVDGRIVYHRHKTHKLYSIKIEEEAQRIIDQWHGDRLLLSFAERCANYRHFYNKANIYLSTLRPGLTMYWARHTWATIAAELDIPDDTIALALGHSARNATTDIYIKRNMAKVDKANRMVIDAVLGNKKPTPVGGG